MKILKERYKNIGMLKFSFHIEYTVKTLQQLYKSLARALQEPYKNFTKIFECPSLSLTLIVL
jgi:hypothetical protein